MNRHEESFVNALNDLREKVKSNDRYQLIKASGILRLLLLDPLIHEVNRKHKIKIKFYLTSRNNRRTNAKSLTLDKFLATEWQANREHTYTIKEIIETSANHLGGVHVKEPKQKKEIDLIEIYEYRPITIDAIKSSLNG